VSYVRVMRNGARVERVSGVTWDEGYGRDDVGNAT
jgi:hypothetical protein